MADDGAASRPEPAPFRRTARSAPAAPSAATAAILRMVAARAASQAGAFKSVLSGRPPSDAFWAEDPAVLFKTLSFFPRAGMTEAEIANAFTRCVIAAAAVLFALGSDRWWVLLVAGVVVAVVFWAVTTLRRRALKAAPRE